VDNEIVLYANGQRLDDLHETSIALLVRLSNGEHLSLDDMEGIDPDEVMEWLENGWIWMNHPE
jgi:50S ribosomal protein L16 3-hydroxylase